MKQNVFNYGEKNIIRKYKFDPDLQNIPDEKEVKAKISHLTGKRRSGNPSVKKNAMKDQQKGSIRRRSIRQKHSKYSIISMYYQTCQNTDHLENRN